MNLVIFIELNKKKKKRFVLVLKQHTGANTGRKREEVEAWWKTSCSCFYRACLEGRELHPETMTRQLFLFFPNRAELCQRAWNWTTQFHIFISTIHHRQFVPLSDQGSGFMAAPLVWKKNKCIDRKCWKWKQALWITRNVVSACFERAVRSCELSVSAASQIPHFNFSGFCLPASPHFTCRLRKRKGNSCWGRNKHGRLSLEWRANIQIWKVKIWSFGNWSHVVDFSQKQNMTEGFLPVRWLRVYIFNCLIRFWLTKCVKNKSDNTFLCPYGIHNTL